MQGNTEEVKKRIKFLLKERGIKIKDLAKSLHLEPRFFSDMLCIKLERLHDISRATGISVYDMITDDNFKRYYNEKGELIKIEKV